MKKILGLQAPMELALDMSCIIFKYMKHNVFLREKLKLFMLSWFWEADLMIVFEKAKKTTIKTPYIETYWIALSLSNNSTSL